MKRIKHTIIITLITCAILLTADNADAKKSNEVIKNGILKEYSGNAKIYTVPNNVKKILKKAFKKAKKLKKVVITENVKEIDFAAFCDAKKVASITVNKKNKKFDSYKGVLYSENHKEILIIPECIKKLVPAKKSTIHDDCYDYIKLRKLESLTIGEKWQKLVEGVWWNLNPLKEIKVEKNNKVFFVEDGNLFRKNEDGKIEYAIYISKKNGEDEYRIPSYVSKINEHAFADANIKKLIIPESVIDIESATFIDCKMETLQIESKNMMALADYDNFSTIWSVNYIPCPNLKNVIFTQTDTVMPPVMNKIFPDNIVISSPVNSTAKTYAEAKGYTWIELK